MQIKQVSHRKLVTYPHVLTCSLLLQQPIANPTSLNKEIPTSQEVKCAISTPLVVTNCRFLYTSLPMIGQQGGFSKNATGSDNVSTLGYLEQLKREFTAGKTGF